MIDLHWMSTYEVSAELISNQRACMKSSALNPTDGQARDVSMNATGLESVHKHKLTLISNHTMCMHISKHMDTKRKNFMHWRSLACWRDWREIGKPMMFLFPVCFPQDCAQTKCLHCQLTRAIKALRILNALQTHRHPYTKIISLFQLKFFWYQRTHSGRAHQILTCTDVPLRIFHVL